MEAKKGGRIADIYKFVLTFVFQLKGKQQHFEQTANVKEAWHTYCRGLFALSL